MRKKMAVLIVMMMFFAAGSASAMKGGNKGMMDCKCLGDGGGMMMDGKGMAGRFKMMAEMLELNAEQQKAVEVIHFAHHKEVIRKAADIDVAEVELQEIMGREQVKVEEAEKKIRAIAALQADLDIMHLKAKEAIKAKLNPEQLEKMKKHMAAGMKGKMEEMGGKCCDKMPCKSRPCVMMKDDSGQAKESDDDDKDPRAGGKTEPFRHH